MGGMPWLPYVHLGWLGLGIKKDAMEGQETALETWILHTLQILGFWLSKSTWPRNVQYVPPISDFWQPRTFRHVKLG